MAISDPPTSLPPPSRIDRRRLAAFALRSLGAPAAGAAVDLAVEPLRGGLEAAAIVRVDARVARDGGAQPQRITFVAKRLDGTQRREAVVYRALLEPLAVGTAPRLLGVEEVDAVTSYLYLEHARAARTWPWREVDRAALVLERLAAVHLTLPVAAFEASGAAWDYEADLHASAAATLDLFERVAAHESLAALRRGRMPLR